MKFILSCINFYSHNFNLDVVSSLLEPNLSVMNSPTSERIIRGGTHPALLTKPHSRYDIIVILLV